MQEKITYYIEESKEGLPTLSVEDVNKKRIYLHGKYNPLKESQTLKDKFSLAKFDAIIILGVGLGYQLIPLKDIIGNYKKIILIDAIEKIENEIKKNPHTSFLVRHRNIIFMTGLSDSDIETALNNEIDFDNINGFDVLEHPASFRAFNGYYSGIKKIIRSIINRKAGNIATQKAFGMLYLRNILRNLRLIPSLYPVSSFFSAIKNHPVLVIASGPSIEKYLKIIKQYQKNFFIITVDSALKTLVHNGILPDFFVSIDPQPFIYEHVFGLNTETTIPIFTLSSHPFMFKKFSKIPSLLSLNTHPFSQIIDEMFPGKIGSIDSLTGTVAGDAIIAAKKFGFGAVGLVGFDFSFLNFNIYPRGTAYQSRFTNVSTRFNSVESMNFYYIMKSSKGIKLENKFTRSSFVRYKESVERLVKSLNIRQIYNINSTGIPIGIRNAGIDDFLADHCKACINKAEIIRNEISVKSPIKKIISFEKIIELINESDIYNDLINASAGEVPQKKTGRLKSFIEKN